MQVILPEHLKKYEGRLKAMGLEEQLIFYRLFMTKRIDIAQVSTVPNIGFCWIWTGKRNSNGYGEMKISKKRERVHKICSRIILGPEYRKDLLDCHKCNVRACINPEHLYQGTALDNNRDTMKAGNHGSVKLKGRRKTHCSRGHELNVDNTMVNKKTGNRQCKICYEMFQPLYQALYKVGIKLKETGVSFRA